MTRWAKRPLCHLVPGPRLAFHTPPKPVSGTRSRHLLQSIISDLCIVSLPLVNRRLRCLALLAESVSHCHKIDPSSAQVLSVTYRSALTSSSNSHSSPSSRLACRSKVARGVGFVKTSEVWSFVSTNFTATLSRCPTSSRISWYSASQCFDLSLSQCSSVRRIAICEYAFNHCAF